MRNSREDTARRPAQRRSLRGLSVSRIRNFVYIVAVGAIAGWQISNPSKRAIEAITGLIVLILLWNVSTLSAIWFIMLAYPFPFGISIGSSNFIFTILIFIHYLIRVSTGQAKIITDRWMNLPIILLISSYILSYYNLIKVHTPEQMRYALIHTFNLFAAILFFYLIVNFVDDEKKLRRAVMISMGTLMLIITFTTLELMFPGKVLIPGWLATKHKMRLVMKGFRMGGPFTDFELLAEYYAMSVPIIFFLLIRSKRLLLRVAFAALLLVDLFMMFTTITRGAFFSLSIALVYMVFICRRDLNLVRLVTLSAAVIVTLFGLEAIVTRYTISGSLFQRVVSTTFERGFVPDSRVMAWGGALNRALRHPIIGHGPGWDFTRSIDILLWPHSAYLYYLNITGFFGLFAFLFLLYRLMRSTFLSLKYSLVTAQFPQSFMKVLHICLVIFIIDQIKIDYLRNDIYTFFIWTLFGLIAATRNIILKSEAEAAGTGETRPARQPVSI